MVLGGSSKFHFNRKSLDVKDLNKILALKNNYDDKNTFL